MSTSLLYHGFGIVGYHHKVTRFEKGTIVFTISPPRLCCPCCGSRDIIHHGSRRRLWKNLPIGHRATYIEYDIPRIECNSCGVIRQVTVGFADERKRHTKRFSRYALELCRLMTIQDVAVHLGVSWNVIKDIQKTDLIHRYARPPLKHLRHIAIDEIAVKKSHKYLTVVLDLDSGAVVFVGDGKGADALDPFWKRVRRSRAVIEAVAMDLSPAYQRAVRMNLPEAAIVFDRFHVVKLMNDKLSQLRRGLQGEADILGKKTLKGTRWLLLKNPDNLNDSRNERQRLAEALDFNKPLACAYYLKEELRLFWEQPDKSAAQRFLKQWCERARDSGIRPMMDMAKTLTRHRRGLLNWYDYPISTGPLEGTNNKIKTMKRQAYGYRDMTFFKLKILALHETKYALVG